MKSKKREWLTGLWCSCAAHWKAKMAVVLAVTVSAANITPAAVLGDPSHKKKTIKVTFQSGENGYFAGMDEDSSTKSNASKSSANRAEWVQNFYDLEEDDQGYFTNLKLGAEEVEAKNQKPIWETVTNKVNENNLDEDDLVFAGWYSFDGEIPMLVSNYKEIYSNATLEAAWYDPEQIEGKAKDEYGVIAIGLEDRKLVVSEPEMMRDIEEVEQWAKSALLKKELKIDGEDLIALELEITGDKENEEGKDKDVILTLSVDEEKLDMAKSVSAIHEKEDGKIEIIPADVVKADDGDGYQVTFTVKDSGEYYLVNTGVYRRPLMKAPARANSAAKIDETETREAVMSGTIGENLSWKIENSVLTISGTGDMPDWTYASLENGGSDEAPPWYKERWPIKTIIIEEGITKIGEYAFYHFANATEIQLPEGLLSIGRAAFQFNTSLESIHIPGSVKSIDSYAFYNCENLVDVDIPNSVMNIYHLAFTNCDKLADTTIIGRGSFGDSLSWEETKKGELTIRGKGEMPDGSAPWSYNIISVDIQGVVTSIGDYAFYGRDKLTSIKIPEGVTRIGKSAFSNCTKLENIIIPKSICRIENLAFFDTGITSVTIPKSVVFLGQKSFPEGAQIIYEGMGESEATFIYDKVVYKEEKIEIKGQFNCERFSLFEKITLEFYLNDGKTNEKKLGEFEIGESSVNNPNTWQFLQKLDDGEYSIIVKAVAVLNGESVKIAQDATEMFKVDRNIPVKTIDGKDYKLFEIDDSQAVILVFGQSNENKSQKTLENLNELAKEYLDSEVKIIFMDIDQEAETVKKFAETIPNIEVCSQKMSGVDYEAFRLMYCSEAAKLPNVFILKSKSIKYESKSGDSISKETFVEELKKLGIEIIAQKLDMPIKTIDGKEYMVSSFSRSQAVLLLFGRSTCFNCQNTLKNINELAEDYNKGDIRFVFMDVDQELEVTKNFAEMIPNIEVCNQKSSGINYSDYMQEYGKVAGGIEGDIFPYIFIVKSGEMVYSNTKGGVVNKDIFISAFDKLGIKNFDFHREAIKNFYKTNPFSEADEVSFKIQPVLKANAYEAGELDDKSVQNGLNALNFMRFIAGLPAVKNDATYQMFAQKGSVVMSVLDEMTHTPDKPADMQEDFYQDAYKGTSQSNIAWTSNKSNLAFDVIQLWMNDGDKSNIERVGHRRWCLNPSMEKTGFGFIDGYGAMYAFNKGKNFDIDYVPWPAKTMPYEYFLGPWSISLNREEYDIKPENIEVILTSGSQSYKFSKSNQSNGYFNVETGYYGLGPAIIFRPDVLSLNETSEINVTVMGVTDKEGNPKDISYMVKFFRMSSNSDSGNSGNSGNTEGSGSSGGGSSSGGSSGGEGGGSHGGGSSSSGGSSSGGSSGGGGGGSHGGGGGGSRSVGGSSSSGGPGSSLPSYVEKGEWTILNGVWRFVDASGNAKVNTWTAAYNPYAVAGQQNYDWFRFDVNGNMMTGWFTDVDGNRYFLNPVSDGTLGKMLTGWVWIADEFGIQRCYYFNPNSDGYRGKLLTNTVIDGYTIDANGCWTIDGVVQVK